MLRIEHPASITQRATIAFLPPVLLVHEIRPGTIVIRSGSICTNSPQGRNE